MNKKIIIGGGGGLCGSHLSRRLCDNGFEVVILDNFSESFEENIDPRVKLYKIDIKDFSKINEIFYFEKPEIVFSFQAMAAEILSVFCKKLNYDDNLITTSNLLSASVNNGVKKFIQAGSIAVFGHEEPPFKETSAFLPQDSYGISKMACYHECRITKKQFGLDYSYIIPHNFQGAFVNATLYRNFIAIASRQAQNNENITIFSDGNQTRQFSHVKYLLDPLIRLMSIDCEIVNLGADKFYKIIEIAEIIKKIAQKDGKNIGFNFLEKRHESVHSHCNHDLAKQKLNFKDNTDIEELCNDVYFWIKSKPLRHQKKAMYEITKNLPEIWR